LYQFGIEAFLASRNANKLAELRATLPGWQLKPLAAEHWPEENGETYEENARLKARFGHDVAPDVWVLGEDSGIECEALGGDPGVHSARWADGDQAEALLARLAAEADRRARMVAVLVAVAPGGNEVRAVGVLEGTIASSKRGDAGFGYDPVFVPDGLMETVAELGEEWKHAHSHRARAAKALAAACARAGRS
jgi:XTP/dITP diphosphohydrolase